MALYDLFLALLDVVNTDIGQHIFCVVLVMFAFQLFHRMGGQ